MRSNLIFRCCTILILLLPLASVHAQPNFHFSGGIEGYIWSSSDANSIPAGYTYGLGFYAAVWDLTPEPARFLQIGLPSTWILPDNTDNTTEPLCPIGTVARDNWPERAPTYGDVFQTIEGGLGYWAGNQYLGGAPKYMMNSTPDCYNGQIATPGWPFFGESSPLPDEELGIAQLSNRILIPPDGMTFSGRPKGQFLGSAYLALPLSFPHSDPYPTGIHNWTLFLNTENFRGPLAYYVPETYSKISENYAFIEGRGLDARETRYGGGPTMEIGSVPFYSEKDNAGNTYSKIPPIQFPINGQDRSVLGRDWAYFSEEALFNQVLQWRDGGPVPEGAFSESGIQFPRLFTGSVGYAHEKKVIEGMADIQTSTVFDDQSFGLQWNTNFDDDFGRFPRYFKEVNGQVTAIEESDLPDELELADIEFEKSIPQPIVYEAPLEGAWGSPGPAAGPFQADLADGSTVVYYWYRFIDQPVFQQYNWTDAEKENLQRMVTEMHANWTIDKKYMHDIAEGDLVSFDENIIVTPPAGFETGYVPLVTKQFPQGQIDCNQLAVDISSQVVASPQDQGRLFAELLIESPIEADVVWHNGKVGMRIPVGRDETYQAVLSFANCDLKHHYSAPFALEASGLDDESFLANWKPVPGAKSYTIDVAVDSLFAQMLPDWNGKETDQKGAIEIDFSNPNVDHYYRLRALGHSGEISENSLTIRVTPMTDQCNFDLMIETSNVSTSSQSDGSLRIVTKGGRVPFQYVWGDGSAGDLRDNLTVGEYAVTVTDAAGCIREQGASVGLPIGSSSLGNRVWNDLNRNGFDDYGEPGIGGVNVALWFDADGDANPESWMGFETTDENGYYLFTDLQPGIYQLFVWEIDNWGLGQPLEGMVNSRGEYDPNNDRDGDDNGQPGSTIQELGDRNIISKPIILTATDEPLLDGDRIDTNIDYDPSGNMTIDFGFYDPAVPCPTINVDFISPDSICGADGVVEAIPVGGQQPHTFSWNGGQTNQMLTQLGSGTYEVTVTDRDGCQGSSLVSIPESSGNPVTYYADSDGDGFGDESKPIIACYFPSGATLLSGDCNDGDASINPDATEIPDNGIDENCQDGDLLSSINELGGDRYILHPNPTSGLLNVSIDSPRRINYSVRSLSGVELRSGTLDGPIDLQGFAPGLYFIELFDERGNRGVSKVSLVR